MPWRSPTSCRRAEGLWVGLWHPNLTAALGFPGAPAAYERLVAALAAERPYMAPLHRVTEMAVSPACGPRERRWMPMAS